MSGSIENSKITNVSKNKNIHDTLPLVGLLLGSGYSIYKKENLLNFIFITGIGLGIGILSKNQLKHGNLLGWH